MKKKLMTIMSLIFLFSTSCQEKIDTPKEEAAIKAVFEEEKAGFFSQDQSKMAETWVKEPTSIKIYMTDKGQTKFDGWEAISKHDQEITKDTTWDRKSMTVSFTNYQISLTNSNAWVMCEAHWEGNYKGESMDFVQTRINVLRKVDGRWKFELMAIYNLPKSKE